MLSFENTAKDYKLHRKSSFKFQIWRKLLLKLSTISPSHDFEELTEFSPRTPHQEALYAANMDSHQGPPHRNPLVGQQNAEALLLPKSRVVQRYHLGVEEHAIGTKKLGHLQSILACLRWCLCTSRTSGLLLLAEKGHGSCSRQPVDFAGASCGCISSRETDLECIGLSF